MPESWNIFSIGRKRGDEDQLTEMLVWLATEVPAVCAAVVRLALPEVEADITEIEASTQHVIAGGRLDAVFSSASLVVVFESKLGSEYGLGQLRKYLDWLAENHSHRADRGLLTVTKRPAPWPQDDIAHAQVLGVVTSPRRWQDLYDELLPVADDFGLDAVSARLVQEFREMLEDEGLIPVRPLSETERFDAWSQAHGVIGRFHDYFKACKDTVAERLAAKPHANRASATQGYIYQDFVTSSGEFISVELNCSDRDVAVTAKASRDVATVRLTVEAMGWPDWNAAKARLEAAPPDDWHMAPNRGSDRPRVWRYLDDVVGAGTFDEQRARFAEACGVATGWLDSCRGTSSQRRGIRPFRR